MICNYSQNDAWVYMIFYVWHCALKTLDSEAAYATLKQAYMSQRNKFHQKQLGLIQEVYLWWKLNFLSDANKCYGCELVESVLIKSRRYHELVQDYFSVVFKCNTDYPTMLLK